MDRQKLLIIFGAAWLSAMGLTWFLYAKTKAPKVVRTVNILAAAKDLPAGTQLKKTDLKLVAVTERDLPKAAITDPTLAYNRALLFPVNANEVVTSSKLTSTSGAEGVAATIEPGKRAVSVAFTDASGVSGLIQPRSRVDVMFTRTGSLAEAMTTTLLEDAVVLSIGRTTEVQQLSGTVGATKAPAVRSQNQTATLMVAPEDARKLELAKNQGKLSLALRNPLDRSKVADTAAATALSLDPSLASQASRKRGPNLRDRKLWAKLTGEEEEPPKPKPEPKKEPPKPRVIVDVFRGDKHVQETFQ